MTGANPTDRDKLGTKRHVLTDQKGIPLSVSITGANTHDMKAAIDTLDTLERAAATVFAFVGYVLGTSVLPVKKIVESL